MLRRRGGLLAAAARTAVVAGTATAVSGGVRARQQRRAEERYQAERYQGEQATVQAAPSQGADLVSRIEELARLREQGVLSDAEFSAAKTRLLQG